MGRDEFLLLWDACGWERRLAIKNANHSGELVDLAVVGECRDQRRRREEAAIARGVGLIRSILEASMTASRKASMKVPFLAAPGPAP
jgi:hypothetical protein